MTYAELKGILAELKEATERMLAGRGKGMEPSPRLAKALKEAQEALNEDLLP